MAVDQLIAGLPVFPLTPGMTIKFEAINPTTGAAITGVTVSAVAIVGVQAGAFAAGGGDVQVGPFMFVPGPGASV
jgi:hypothetical protein